MNNAVWWELACKRIRRDAARLLKWIGPKLLMRAAFAFGAVAAVLAFVALGWIPPELVKEIFTAIGAVLTLF